VSAPPAPIGNGWLEVEVVNDRLGAPTLSLSGRAAEISRELGIGRIHVSLTHTHTTAAAMVTLEEKT